MKGMIPLAAVMFAALSAHAVGTCQDQLVPAYFYPGTSSPWATAEATHTGGQFMVANPASGPGSSVNPDYTAEVGRAHTVGLLVLGYVHTSYGARASVDVKAEISNWANWYAIDGIFLDEVASTVGTNTVTLNYYQDLANYVTTTLPGSDLVLNPGVYPDEAYANITLGLNMQLTLVTFEGTYASYPPSVPAWVGQPGSWNYPSSRFAHLVYAVPSSVNAQSVVTTSNDLQAGYVYATNDQWTQVSPYDPSGGSCTAAGSNCVLNPWDTLSSWNSTVVAAASCN
jgi:Spherulation-specific family 4